jgi:hypothetical protein
MKYLTLLLSFLFVQSLSAQEKLPVIKATSKSVTIRDGGEMYKGSWSLDTTLRPDVYTAYRSRKTKWVIFYTDVDSIRVKVTPGSSFNFVVLWNGKDSCFTQIKSAISPEPILKNAVVIHDTIPFTLTSYNAIAVKAVVNGTDSVTLHFDTGSWDFRLTKDAILKKTSLLSNQSDALAGKAEPNFNKLNKVSKIQMGKLTWNDPEIEATGFTAHEMDGRFGWNLFEGKQVEVDYDKGLIIIHSGLPKRLTGYVKAPIEFIRSFMCIKGDFEISGKKHSGNFLMDTGADQAIILDSTWTAKEHFSDGLKLIKTITLTNPRGVKFNIRVVLAPAFKLNGFNLTNIPVAILGSSSNPAGFQINNLGNDLLKRFNMIIDLKNDCIYLKPNKLTAVEYRNSKV